MSVRCKFEVVELKKTKAYGSAGKPIEAVVLAAVSNETNKSWSKWTPSGRMELQITNEAALEQFEVGKYFFIDFTPAPATEAEETK